MVCGTIDGLYSCFYQQQQKKWNTFKAVLKKRESRRPMVL